MSSGYKSGRRYRFCRCRRIWPQAAEIARSLEEKVTQSRRNQQNKKDELIMAWGPRFYRGENSAVLAGVTGV